MVRAANAESERPAIMDWTVLPAGVIAQAWTDADFRARLLKDPTRVLHERLPRRAEGKTFVVCEDADQVKYYALPQLAPELVDAGRDELMALLDHEMGDHNEADDEWLPKPVIADALLDPGFRARLLADAAGVLRERGYTLPAERVVVLENTRSTFHLVLPRSPSAQDELDFDALERTLQERFTVPPDRTPRNTPMHGPDRGA